LQGSPRACLARGRQVNHDLGAFPLGSEPACPIFSWVKDANSLDILVPDGDFHKHRYGALDEVP